VVLDIYKSNSDKKRNKKDDDLWDRWNWKKIVRTVFISVSVAFLALCVMLVVLVKKSSSFRQAVLAQAEHSVYGRTGARVSARDFTLGFFPLKLDLYGLVVHGSEPEFSQPLMHADHVGAELKLSSLRYRRWNLRSLVVDHPVVHYSVSASGQSNLPQPEDKSRSTTHVFDLAVEKVQIRQGEVYYGDTKAPLEAELHRLRLTADYDGAATHYSSALRYAQGNIRAGTYALLDHALESNFELTPAKLTVKHLALTAGKFRLSLAGSVEDYSRPAIQATFYSQLEAADLETVLKTTLPFAGALHLAGSGNYRADPSHPMLQAVSLNGTMTSPSLIVNVADLRANALDAGAKFKLSAGNAEFENIHAQMFGGSLTGSLSIHDVGGAAYSVLETQLKNATLEQLQKTVRRTTSPEAGLSGVIQGDAVAAWYMGFKDLVAHGNATLQGALGPASATPLRAVIHAEYEAAGRKLSFHQSYLKTAQTTLNLDGNTGSFGDESSLQVSLKSGNLHEVELLAENFPAALGPLSGLWPQSTAQSTPQATTQTTAQSTQPTEKLDLYGSATFTAFISNSGGVPELKGQLEARNLRVKGTSWKLVHTDIEVTPSSLAFSNGNLEAAFPEHKAGDSPHPVHIRISSMPLRRIQEAEANLHSPAANESR
jgi:translocation and assembly module TamB